MSTSVREAALPTLTGNERRTPHGGIIVPEFFLALGDYVLRNAARVNTRPNVFTSRITQDLVNHRGPEGSWAASYGTAHVTAEVACEDAHTPSRRILPGVSAIDFGKDVAPVVQALDNSGNQFGSEQIVAQLAFSPSVRGKSGIKSAFSLPSHPLPAGPGLSRVVYGTSAGGDVLVLNGGNEQRVLEPFEIVSFDPATTRIEPVEAIPTIKPSEGGALTPANWATLFSHTSAPRR